MSGLLLTGAGPSGGGASFDPSSLSPSAWWKADAITGLTDGQVVTTWLDSSGNSKDVTQATVANKPLYKTAIVNGKAVVRYVDSTDELAVGSVAQKTVLAVATMPAGVDGAVVQGTAYMYRANADGFLRIYGGTEFTTAGAITGGTFYVLGAVFNGASSVATVNGTTYNGNAGVAGTGSLSIGSGTGRTAGDVAEVIVFSTVLSAADRRSVESYLGAKYGITVV